jgi:hypothetical protein
VTDDKIEIIVEDSEEIPTNVRKKIKVLEMPVFTEADKKNIEKMVDRLDKFISDVYSERVTVNMLRDDIKGLGTGRLENEERIVSFLGRAVHSIEAINQSLADLKLAVREALKESVGVLDNKIEEKLYALDSTISYMKGMLIDTSEKINALQGGSETKMALLTENISEKFDAHIANLNNRLDNLVLQVVEPTNDISLRLDALKKDIDAIKKDIDALKRAKLTIKIPKIKIPRIRVPKLPTNAFEMLNQAKKNLKSKRVPKKKQPEKKRLITSVDSLHDRVLDLFIFSTLGTNRMTITALKKEIPVSETKVRKRVAELVKRRKIKKLRRGKLVTYSVS